MKNKRRIKFIIGIDEVGRGPIAGPITLVALLLPVDFDFSIFKVIKDSKKMSPKKREEIAQKMKLLKKDKKVDYVISSMNNNLVDQKGLSFCLKKCIEKCLKNLQKISSAFSKEVLILLDGGLKAPREYKNQQTIIRGDESELVISLASIIAKVARDRKMVLFATKFPHYGFARHKGYGTKFHYQAIKKYGRCPLHRLSFLKNIGL